MWNNWGRAPALAARPLGYRLRFGSLARALATSIRTATTIFLASFDDSTQTIQGKVCSSDPTGRSNGVRKSRGAENLRRYAAKSLSALASSMLLRS